MQCLSYDTDSDGMKVGWDFIRIFVSRIVTHRGTRQTRQASSDEPRIMSTQSREAKVFTILALSMIVGVIILKALGGRPLPAGAFCLSRYHQAEPAEEAIRSEGTQVPDWWGHIEVYYSGTKSGNVEKLASLEDLPGPEHVNCHFVICNGIGGGDGEIQSTEIWQRQRSVAPRQNGRRQGRTIHICLIADGETARPTDCQIEAVAGLVAGLCKRFNIQPECITVVATSAGDKAL